MVTTLVSINIEQAVPAQIEIVAIVAVPVPAVKVGVPTQPVRIMMSVANNMRPVVHNMNPVVTAVCQSLGYRRDEQGARDNQ